VEDEVAVGVAGIAAEDLAVEGGVVALSKRVHRQRSVVSFGI